MEMTNEVREWVRGLSAGSLTDLDIERLLDLLLLLDSSCLPKPTTRSGKRTAASTYIRFMQGDMALPQTWNPSTWRTGHAR